MRYNVSFLVICFILASGELHDQIRSDCCADSDVKRTPGKLLEADINLLLTDDAVGEYRIAIWKTLEASTLDDLTKLKKHPNWGIAAQAAWMEWVDDRRQFSGRFQSSRVRDGASRWLGFLEGRLNTTPPEVWCNIVRTARPREVPPIIDRNPSKMTPFLFETVETVKEGMVELLPGLFGDKDVIVIRKYNMLSVQPKGSVPFSINLDKIEIDPLDDSGRFSTGSVIECYSYTEYDVVILRRFSFGRFCMMVFPKDKSVASWTKVIGGDDVLVTLGSKQDHVVEVMSTKDTLIVFGRCFCSVYIESFNAKTGKRTGRFNSALW